MTRQIELSRDEAELLTDILFLSDHHSARELSAYIRERFGMSSEAAELAARGKTMAEYRKQHETL